MVNPTYKLNDIAEGHFPLFQFSNGNWKLREIDTLEYSRPEPGKKYISPDQSLAFMCGENSTVIRQFFCETGTTDEYLSLGIAVFGVAAYNVAFKLATQPDTGHGNVDVSHLTGNWDICINSGALQIRRDVDYRLANITHHVALDWVENF